MEWWSMKLYVLDDGDGYPGVISCTYNGVTGCAIVAFTDQHYANQYVYRRVGRPVKIREAERKNSHGKMIHTELARVAREYTDDTVATKAVAMVINPTAPEPTWISIEDVMDLGLKQRNAAKAKGELWS